MLLLSVTARVTMAACQTLGPSDAHGSPNECYPAQGNAMMINQPRRPMPDPSTESTRWRHLQSTHRLLGMVVEVRQRGNLVGAYDVMPGQQVIVGRHRDCDIAVSEDGGLSRSHFVIECSKGHAIVRDLESTNGTLVNGNPVVARCVSDGDIVTAGRTTFTVRMATCR